jgi:hypothetical protein
VRARYALESFLQDNTVHVPWTQEEERLLRDYQMVGRWWRVLARTWETRGSVELKNGWYDALRHRVHGHIDDIMTLGSIFKGFGGSLPVARLAGD